MDTIPTLTREEFERLDNDVAAALLRARFEALVEAGCGYEAAVIVAAHPEIALTQAVGLLRRGCPARTAVRILL